jgi:hypothetical protein
LIRKTPPIGDSGSPAVALSKVSFECNVVKEAPTCELITMIAVLGDFAFLGDQAEFFRGLIPYGGRERKWIEKSIEKKEGRQDKYGMK